MGLRSALALGEILLFALALVGPELPLEDVGLWRRLLDIDGLDVRAFVVVRFRLTFSLDTVVLPVPARRDRGELAVREDLSVFVDGVLRPMELPIEVEVVLVVIELPIREVPREE